MYITTYLYNQHLSFMKHSLEWNNQELSFWNLDKNNEAPADPRRAEDAQALHGRAEQLVGRIDRTLVRAEGRTQELSYAISWEIPTWGAAPDFSLWEEASQEVAEENITPEWLSLGEEVTQTTKTDPEVEKTGEEEKTSEEVLAEAEKLALELGYEDFLAEAEQEGILEGKTPEEIEKILADRLATLEAEKARIEAELQNPSLDAGTRTQLETRRDAIGMMQNTYSWGGQGSLNGPGGNFYSGGIGIDPQDAERYGPMGGQLATWLQQKWFPVYNGAPSHCGQNVGEAMNAFYRDIWMPQLQIQDRPRHGFKWAEIMANKPDQFVKINCRAEDAPAGALISYKNGPGGSAAFADFGHIEIALWQGKWFYFGTVANSPGGSKRPPVEWDYAVYMPKWTPWESPTWTPWSLTS